MTEAEGFKSWAVLYSFDMSQAEVLGGIPELQRIVDKGEPEVKPLSHSAIDKIIKHEPDVVLLLATFVSELERAKALGFISHVSREVKKRHAKTKVLVVTNEETNLEQELKDKGVTDVIPSTMTYEQVGERVRKAFVV